MLQTQQVFVCRVRNNIIKAFALFLGLCFGQVAMAQGAVVSAYVSKTGGYEKFVFTVHEPKAYKVFDLESPYRVVIDFKDAKLATDLSHLARKSRHVVRVRAAVRNRYNLRVVLDLRSPVSYRAEAGDSRRHERDLVLKLYHANRSSIESNSSKEIDFAIVDDPSLMKGAVSEAGKSETGKSETGKSETGKGANGQPVAQAVPTSIPQATPIVVKRQPVATKQPLPLPVVKKSSPSRSALREVVIVVDAGHGGVDPGAIGPSKTKEKHVVLSIAKRLENLLKKEKGFRAIMTRSEDKKIPLEERREVARRHQADLFISIHADAFRVPDAKGASIYALSQQGATSATAQWLAESATDADLIGGAGGVSLEGKDLTLKSVLLDLSMTASLNESLKAGGNIIHSLSHVSPWHGRKQVELANFVVLQSPDIPSILVETGFISNPQEEKRLRSRRYQQKVADAIFKGIRQYFSKNPPPGTYLAASSS